MRYPGVHNRPNAYIAGGAPTTSTPCIIAPAKPRTINRRTGQDRAHRAGMPQVPSRIVKKALLATTSELTSSKELTHGDTDVGP